MKVTFASFGADIASSRLRALIPQRELGKLGIEKGNDVLVYGKHLLSKMDVSHFRRLVFDICDNHFGNEELAPYYREHATMADLVTCNSEVMREIIKKETGRDAVLISEPYETDEFPASIGPKLLWFGHATNFPDLERILPDLKHPLLALSNHPECGNWTMERQRNALKSDCIVIIPTGKSMAKSENRMVESIRNGKYVCAEYLPAYKPFDQFFPLGSIPENVDDALRSPNEAIARIRAAQDYIQDKYSPKAIGEQWMRVLNEHIHL